MKKYSSFDLFTRNQKCIEIEELIDLTHLSLSGDGDDDDSAEGDGW
jgi:hypothetical protein